MSSETGSQRWSFNIRRFFSPRVPQIFLPLMLGVFFFALVVLMVWMWSNASAIIRGGTQILQRFPDTSIEVIAPSVVLVDDEEQIIRVSLLRDIPTNETVRLTVILPEGLKASEWGRRTTVDLSNANRMIAIPITNLRTLFWGREAQIVVTARTAGGDISQLNLPISIESTLLGGTRHVTNLLVGNNPSIFLLTSLVSGTGVWLFNHLQKEQEEIRKKMKKKIKACLEEIKKGDLDRARQRFEDISEISVSESERELLDNLLKLAEGQVKGDMLKSVVTDCFYREPEATIVMYLRGYDALLKVNPAALRDIRPKLLDKANGEQADAFNGIDTKEADVQPRNWPPKVGDMGGGLVPFMDTPFVIEVLDGKNPFPVEDALLEEDRLFRSSNPLFSDAHPIYKRLLGRTNSTVIAGHSGSGRTAMALALTHNTTREYLTLYQPWPWDWQMIQAGFARQLLAFLKLHPTHLSSTNASERQLLAGFLTENLGREYLLAELGALRADPLQHRRGGKTGGEKWTFWTNTSAGYLHLLEEDVRHLQAVKGEPFTVHHLAACARAFQFTKLRLVLDVDDQDGVIHIFNHFYPRLREWKEQSLHAFMFIPTEAFSSPDWRGLLREELHWTQEEIEQMMVDRYKSVMGKQTQIAALFEEAAWSSFLQEAVRGATGGPRQAIRLWNSIIDHIPVGQEEIRDLDVQKAVARSRWRYGRTNRDG